MGKAGHQAVIITGGSGGIGTSLAETFRNQGFRIINLDLVEGASAPEDFFQLTDLQRLVTDEVYRAAVFRAIHDYLDQNSIGLKAVINNAARQVVADIKSLSVDDFRASLDINVTACFVLIKEFLPLLRQTSGAVVNIGSIHAKLTKSGFCAYSSSKAALSGLTRALSLDLAPEVTVNCILPAATNTPMLVEGFREKPELLESLRNYHPVGRIAEAAEISNLAFFLCSEQARFITGAEISVDGGIGNRLHDPA